jgi:hypothetical protein
MIYERAIGWADLFLLPYFIDTRTNTKRFDYLNQKQQK